MPGRPAVHIEKVVHTERTGMSTQSIEQGVFALTRKMLPGAANKTITRDMDLLMDLEADSLSLVSLIFAIEEKFGIGASELGSLVTESRTVGDLVAAVEIRQKS
jgi:acyl carrier protein